MAQSTANQTYDRAIREKDYFKVVTNISPDETPYLSSFGDEEVLDVYKRWTTDSLSDAADNAKIEGQDFVFAKTSDRVETGNYTQIFQTTVEVTKSQRKAKVNVGVKDEFTYQLGKAMKEHANDIEYALVNGTGNSGSSGVARRLKGVLSWLTTNVGTGTATGTGTAGETLTSSMLNDALEDIWENGGNADTIDANGTQKRIISAMTAGATKQLQQTEKKLIERVDIYESDFGIQKVKLHRYLPRGVVVLRTSEYWKMGVFRPTEKYMLASTGSSDKAGIETELTLLSLQEKASAKVIDLKYTP